MKKEKATVKKYKGLICQCSGMNIKQKVRIKTQQTSIDICLNQIL